MGNQENTRHVLLVEGQNDQHVISHLWRSRNTYDGDLPFEVIDKEGYTKLRDSIPLEINAPGRKAIGIVIDANDDASTRWNAVIEKIRKSLEKEGVELPQSPEKTGLIVPETLRCPRIGVWLMPNNEHAGELEDFVAKMIPGNDPVWPLAKGYIDSIPEQDRKFTEKKKPRAKVHAWLATREEPRRMGVAIRAGDLDATGPLCTAFLAWLRRLFEPAS